MSTQVLRRRGSTVQHSTFVGGLGETTFDTDLNRPVVHNGALAGGFPAAMLHLSQLFPLSQTLAADENFFGNTTDPNNAIVFFNPAGAGTNTLDFRTNGTLDANFLRKYNTTPFQIELAASGNLDLVVDSRDVATGTAIRFLTNGIRDSGTQTLLLTIQDNGVVAATGTVRIVPAANTEAVAVTGFSLTGASAQSFIDLAGTWNTSGAPAGIKLNVTNTASNVASRLLDLQVSFATKFSVGVSGAVSIFPTANNTALTTSGYSLTGANVQPIFDLSGSWNTSGTPTAIKLNIVDTTSNAASLLLDLQIGSASKFSVSKLGAVGFADGVTQIFNPNGTSAGINVGANAADPAVLVNGDIWYQSTANELRARINGATVALGASGASPPFTDTNALVAGSGDPTKLMRFEVDGFTTATTRVLTVPNADFTIAGLQVGNLFTVAQSIGATGIVLYPDGSAEFANSGTPVLISATGDLAWGGISALLSDGGASFAAGVITIGSTGLVTFATGGAPLTIDDLGILSWGNGVSQLSIDGSLLVGVATSLFTADVTAQGIGFFGAGAVGQQTVVALTNSTGGTTGNTIVDNADGVIYANDANDIRNNFSSLADKINEILTALNNYGLVAP